MTALEKLQLAKYVDRILHTPGNVVKGQQLEMAFVLDCSCDKEYLKTMLSDSVAALKLHNQIFQNVRSNVIYWSGKNLEEEKKHIIAKTMPMSFLQTNKPFEEEGLFQALVYDCAQESIVVENPPVFDELCAYLKMYQARSKCILVFTTKNYVIEDKKRLMDSLYPFLKSKLLLITVDKMMPASLWLNEIKTQ